MITEQSAVAAVVPVVRAADLVTAAPGTSARTRLAVATDALSAATGRPRRAAVAPVVRAAYLVAAACRGATGCIATSLTTDLSAVAAVVSVVRAADLAAGAVRGTACNHTRPPVA